MSRTALLYAVIGSAALLAGLAVPYALHRSGSAAVPGWQGLANPGPLSAAHRFTAERCEACHTPHVGVEAGSCVACHAAAPALLAKQSTAFHATIGDCRGCHVEHEGGTTPTAMDHAALAAAGYERTIGDADLRTPADRLVRLAEALGLRGDHRTDPAHLDCTSCHSNQDPHRGLFGRECGSCHGVAGWSIAAYRHPSPGSTDCAQCHQAPPSHYMMHFEMVSQKVAGQEHARVEQCYLCHTTDSWNNIKEVGWYDHH
jgi:hypothetical protein